MESDHIQSRPDGAADSRADITFDAVARMTRVVQLVKQHRPALVRHVKRILNCAEDAEDVVQELCVRLMRARDFWRGERQVYAFLFKIATNLARDELRRRRRVYAQGAHFPYESIELVGMDPQPDEIVERHIAMEAVARAVMILPPRPREVFELHVDGQMSYRAISKRLGISIKTVERDIGCAREFCQHRLGISSPGLGWRLPPRSLLHGAVRASGA